METVGRVLLWVIGLQLLSAYPLSEMARGMATNSSVHPRSRGAAALSLIGMSAIAAAVLA